MVRNPNIIILLHKEDKTMTNQVPKTDGRGFPSGAYLNQNHPMDRTQWLEDTFPEWGSFLNREIEGYEVPKGQVSLWWCGGPSWVLKTDEGGIFMIDQYCGPSMYTELYYCGVCKQAGADSINWIRLNPQVIDPWKFNHIDGIFCTHAHQDHCDLYAVKAMTATTDAPFFKLRSASNTLRAAAFGVELSTKIKPAARQAAPTNGILAIPAFITHLIGTPKKPYIRNISKAPWWLATKTYDFFRSIFSRPFTFTGQRAKWQVNHDQIIPG